MKRYKYVLAMVLVLSLVATGVIASACLAEEKIDVPVTITRVITSTFQGTEMTDGQNAVTIAFPPLDTTLYFDVHQQRYLTYLVKEFDPEALPEWEKAFAERKQAAEQFKQMLKPAPDFLAVSPPSIIGEVEIKSEPGQPGKGKKIFAARGIGIDIDQLEARMEVLKEFGSAVEKNDPAAIKNVLPKVLADYQKTTEDMLKAVMNAE